MPLFLFSFSFYIVHVFVRGYVWWQTLESLVFGKGLHRTTNDELEFLRIQGNNSASEVRGRSIVKLVPFRRNYCRKLNLKAQVSLLILATQTNTDQDIGDFIYLR